MWALTLTHTHTHTHTHTLALTLTLALTRRFLRFTLAPVYREQVLLNRSLAYMSIEENVPALLDLLELLDLSSENASNPTLLHTTALCFYRKSVQHQCACSSVRQSVCVRTQLRLFNLCLCYCCPFGEHSTVALLSSLITSSPPSLPPLPVMRASGTLTVETTSMLWNTTAERSTWTSMLVLHLRSSRTCVHPSSLLPA